MIEWRVGNIEVGKGGASSMSVLNGKAMGVCNYPICHAEAPPGAEDGGLEIILLDEEGRETECRCSSLFSVA